jgi:hypothetical protein
MGGGLSVCNKTSAVAHISFAQVGPLYYQNYVNPGDCMTKNGIGNIHVTINARLGIQGNEYNDGDIALPIAACVASAFALVCPAVGAAAIGFEATCLSAGFAVSSAVTTTGSCAMLIGAGSAGVVAVTGSMSIANAVKEIAVSESGYYTNCKRWDLIGGPATIEIIDSNGDHKRIPHLGGGGTAFGLTNGHHYDCVD